MTWVAVITNAKGEAPVRHGGTRKNKDARGGAYGKKDREKRQRLVIVAANKLRENFSTEMRRIPSTGTEFIAEVIPSLPCLRTFREQGRNLESQRPFGRIFQGTAFTRRCLIDRGK